MRLNLGGRDKKIQGFLTVDLYSGDGVDINADISNLHMIQDGSVKEIYASHCLEHFSHRKTLDVLKEWARVLDRGGRLYISVPDFDVIINLYLEIGLTDFVRDLIWGGQEYDLAYHYTGFTYPSLSKAIMKAGFSDIKKLEKLPYGVSDCSKLKDTTKGEQISINCEAIK